MNFKGYRFPHPVLGLGDDVSGKADAKSTIDEKSDNLNYILNVAYQIENKDLLELLEKSEIEFVCEISCSSTLYRKAERTFNLEQKVLIPKNSIRGNVELLFLIVCKSEIRNYKNSEVHADYHGYDFDLDKGDIVAYLGEGSFVAGIEFSKLKAVSSFMEVIQGPNESGEFNIILDNPKIQVQLSKEDYNLFSNIGRRSEWVNVFHSSFVLPTLIHALYQIRPDGRSEYQEKPWAKIILSRMSNEFPGIVLEEDNIPRIAQLFLGYPNDRMLKDLFNQLSPQDESEN